MVSRCFCLFTVKFLREKYKLNIYLFILSLCGEEPFKGENNKELYRKVLKGSFDTDLPTYQALSMNAKDFIMRLLVVDKNKRLNVYQALKNPWLLGQATKNDILSSSVENLRVIINKKKTQVKKEKKI